MESFQIKRLCKDDWQIAQSLTMLFQEVFEMESREMVKQAYWKQLLENTNFWMYAVFCEKEVVGGLTAYELPKYYASTSELFIYDIAVKRSFQRKGIGKKLLLLLQKDCKKIGIKEIFVDVHEEDAHALDFYRATGGKGEQVVQFTYET